MSRDPLPANSSITYGTDAADNAREHLSRSRLRRNRALATGLLGLMGATFFATHMVDEPGFGVLLLRAGAEAGVVGGLADWFAVTAMFRHPLGLPIPHTAIIPNSKDRIGQALGRFVERHFLTEEAVLSKIRTSHPARRLAAWAANPEVASATAGTLVAAMPYVIRSLENRDLHEFVQRTLGEQLRQADFATVLGRAIDLLRTSGEGDVLFERVIAIAARWLEENRGRLDQLVQHRSRWWIPKTINRRIAAAITKGMADLLHELRDSDSSARMQFREALSNVVTDLLSSPEQQRQLDEAKNRLIEHPDIQAWIAAVWHDVSQATLNDLARPSSKIRTGIEKAIVALGQAVGSDEAMQGHIDSVIERTARHLVAWRSEIGGFITEVVRGWDSRALTDRLELVVGSDLQYIRMNGTIVGALVGCVLFLSVRLVG